MGKVNIFKKIKIYKNGFFNQKIFDVRFIFHSNNFWRLIVSLFNSSLLSKKSCFFIVELSVVIKNNSLILNGSQSPVTIFRNIWWWWHDVDNSAIVFNFIVLLLLLIIVLTLLNDKTGIKLRWNLYEKLTLNFVAF